MNNVVLIGRLAADPELRYTAGNNTAVCRFSLAVDRRFKSENQPTVDFISIVAWRQQAEFISKYFCKGNRIAIVGSLQTRSWEDADGNKHYATDVVVDSVEFCESKTSVANTSVAVATTVPGQQQPIDNYFSIDDETCPY